MQPGEDAQHVRKVDLLASRYRFPISIVNPVVDSQIPEVKELLTFDCVSPIKTVHGVLEGAGCLEMLTDQVFFPVAVVLSMLNHLQGIQTNI